MRRLLVLLTLLLGPAAVAGPPEGVSGRMVLDEVTRRKAEVRRCEREAERAEPPLKATALGQLAEARARLAEAEGRAGAAAAEWRKVLAYREEELRRAEAVARDPRFCGPAPSAAILRGPVAEARCRLAEAEGDRPALAAGLPKVIAYGEARLELARALRERGAIPPEETEEEKGVRKDLRDARQRLDAVRRGWPAKGSEAKGR
jgi:hypothetical protein